MKSKHIREDFLVSCGHETLKRAREEHCNFQISYSLKSCLLIEKILRYTDIQIYREDISYRYMSKVIVMLKSVTVAKCCII